MKRTGFLKIIVFVTLTALALHSCIEEGEDWTYYGYGTPSVKTEKAENITASSAEVKVTEANMKLLVAADEQMTHTVAIDHTAGSFKRKIAKLFPSTTYYYRLAAFDNLGGRVEGQVMQLTTAAYDITAKNVTNHEATILFDETIADRLLVADNSDLTGAKTYEQGTTLTGLTPGTTYYFAYESTDLLGQTRRSAVKQFQTRRFWLDLKVEDVTTATATLRATIGGMTAGDAVPTVYFRGETSDYGSVKTPQSDGSYVLPLGVLQANSTFQARAYFFDQGQTVWSETLSFTTDRHRISGAIDMGTSAKWAEWNVGARSPEEYGGLYYLGDVEGKMTEASIYDLAFPYMKEYNRDIAYNKWGGKWRLPSMQDFNELANVCDMTVETLNGVQGLRCTSRVTGNSIFFPAAGRRSNYHFDVADRGKVLEMWTGGYPTLGNFTKDGLYAYFMLSTSTSFVSRFNDFRVGRSIRPVNDDYYPYSY